MADADQLMEQTQARAGSDLATRIEAFRALLQAAHARGLMPEEKAALEALADAVGRLCAAPALPGPGSMADSG